MSNPPESVASDAKSTYRGVVGPPGAGGDWVLARLVGGRACGLVHGRGGSGRTVIDLVGFFKSGKFGYRRADSIRIR